MQPSVLHSLLQSAAGRQILEAAKDRLTSVEPEDAGSPLEPSDFGFVFALAIEAGGLVDLLSDVTVTRGHGVTVRQGRRGDRRVTIIESGAGRENAVNATAVLLDVYKPRWVISAGFAGALAPELRRSDLLVGTSLVDAEGRQWEADPATLPSWLPDVKGLRMGRFLTWDRVVCLPAEKKSLGEKYGALAVDMESLAVAEVCRLRETQFMAVRVVSDAADDELPPDVERLLVQKTNAGRLGAALGSIWRRPSSLKDMFQLQQNAIAASDRLAKFLAGLIKHLPGNG